jgi:hypothetical protein
VLTTLEGGPSGEPKLGVECDDQCGVQIWSAVVERRKFLGGAGALSSRKTFHHSLNSVFPTYRLPTSRFADKFGYLT